MVHRHHEISKSYIYIYIYIYIYNKVNKTELLTEKTLQSVTPERNLTYPLLKKESSSILKNKEEKNCIFTYPAISNK